MSVITVTAPDVDRSTPAGNREYCSWCHREVEAARKLGCIVHIKNPHPRRRGPTRTAAEAKEAKRIYQHHYYLAHKAKAKRYQAEYSREHKKKQRPKVDCKGGLPRPKTRRVLHPSHLMHDSTPHFERDFAAVIRGEKIVVGV